MTSQCSVYDTRCCADTVTVSIPIRHCLRQSPYDQYIVQAGRQAGRRARSGDWRRSVAGPPRSSHWPSCMGWWWLITVMACVYRSDLKSSSLRVSQSVKSISVCVSWW